MKLYICVTHDEYELPIAVADSTKELAQMLGVKSKTIVESLCRVRNGTRGWCRYKEIEIEEEKGDGNELVE